MRPFVCISQGKTPLDFCTFETAFQFKVIANRLDVFIISDAANVAFVKQLCAAIEKYHIKCDFAVSDVATATKLIDIAKGVIFVLSRQSAVSKVPPMIDILMCISPLETTKRRA